MLALRVLGGMVLGSVYISAPIAPIGGALVGMLPGIIVFLIVGLVAKNARAQQIVEMATRAPEILSLEYSSTIPASAA